MFNCEILADSLSPQGCRLTTMKVTFPRFILAEFNTHRVFSRNSASSRAIPFKKMVKMVEENPFIPIAWQKDHKGMQGTEYLTGNLTEYNWLKARDKAVEQAKILHGLDVTKQVCNRLLEPFMWHTVIVTATEWENFFNLRCPQYYSSIGEKKFYDKSWKDYLNNSKARGIDSELIDSVKDVDIIAKLKCNKSQAEIHIQAIAELMWDAYNSSTPKDLNEGEWHIPFGNNFDSKKLSELSISGLQKRNDNIAFLKVKIATARCARISYETLGDNPKIDYEADIKLHDLLLASGHMSPFEHCAKAMTKKEISTFNFKCRNFKGFIQYRSIVD